MKLSEFTRKRKLVTFFILQENIWCFTKPIELFFLDSGKSVTFKTLDEMLQYRVGKERVQDIIAQLDDLYIPELSSKGGRGGRRNNKSFKFDHAKGSGDENHNEAIAPAYANTKIKSKTFEGALAEFKRNHLLSDKEFAYEVDGDGYVHQYKKGGATSVAISTRAKVRKGDKTMIVHNHPNGSNFSDGDLLSTAAERNSKGIIASGKKYDYKFEKSGNFKANAFAKAVKTATLEGKDYDDAADKWLAKNQKKYGYKYSRTPNNR